jgi:hypothetical protein
MMLQTMLAVTGPALTAAGAGLLAYDVLRAPARKRREQRHEAKLEAAEEKRDVTAMSLAESGSLSTGEHKAELAVIDAHHAKVVQRAETRHENAEKVERVRTFQLAVVGFCLVMVGGVAEAIAAILNAA